MREIDPEIKALQDSIFLSKVARARRTPIGEKLADGPRLFDESVKSMRLAISSANPEFTADEIEAEVDRRLKIAKRIAEGNIYQDAGFVDEQS